MTLVAPDGLRTAILKFVENVAQIFRVELGREGGRTYQIAENNGQVPALELAGSVGLVRAAPGRGRRCRSLTFQNGVAQLLAMAEGHTERREVVLGQFRQRLAINVILGKDIGVTAKAEALEPLPQVAHWPNG